MIIFCWKPEVIGVKNHWFIHEYIVDRSTLSASNGDKDLIAKMERYVICHVRAKPQHVPCKLLNIIEQCTENGITLIEYFQGKVTPPAASAVSPLPKPNFYPITDTRKLLAHGRKFQELPVVAKGSASPGQKYDCMNRGDGSTTRRVEGRINSSEATSSRDEASTSRNRDEAGPSNRNEDYMEGGNVVALAIWSRDLDRHYSGHFSFAVIQANKILEDFSQVEVGRRATFIGVYDGHGGHRAARFVREHLVGYLMDFRIS